MCYCNLCSLSYKVFLNKCVAIEVASKPIRCMQFTIYRSNWEELPKYQTLDELSTVNYQVTVTNTGSRSGAIAVLAYMTFTVCLTPLHYHAVMLLFTL